jgi:hypothetical protein
MLKIVLIDLWQNSFLCINFPFVKILKESQNIKNYLCVVHDTLAPAKWSKCTIAVFSSFILIASLMRQVYKRKDFCDLKAFI